MVETYLKRKQWYFSPVLKESSSMVLINAEQNAAMAPHNRENIPVPNREREREEGGGQSWGFINGFINGLAADPRTPLCFQKVRPVDKDVSA